LDHPEVVSGVMVDIEVESETLIERFGPVDIAYGEQYEFEFVFHSGSFTYVYLSTRFSDLSSAIPDA
jgi:hypothetical protein